MKRIFVGAVLSFSLMSPITLSAMAAPAYRVISRDVARLSTVDVQVGPGRATAIDFSQAHEHITYVLLADPSRLVYAANASIDSGQANTLFLRPIRPLKFPGATTTSITNLSVQTLDQAGQQRLYNFNVYHVAQPQYVGVMLSPYQVQPPLTNLQPAFGLLHIDRIEQGLELAIRQGYTPATDPIVARIKTMLTLVRGNRLTIAQAATSAQVPINVLKALERLGTPSNESLESDVVHPSLPAK
ncbi:MAG: hypothetical protein KME45_32940 [Stenomitos rutilans HA7619-LM2]|nr:hypothetical protein [Stenomitos rutilans HA7619-LM2]